MAGEQDPEYLLGATQREVERLTKQHTWIQTCLKGKIVFAPVDLQNPSLRVLDVGCADGALLRDLQKQVTPTAELVGVDLMKQFLPESPSGNISFAVGDICKPPIPDHAAVFDLTHVRYVMAGAGSVGIDQAVQNLADTLAPGGWLQIQELDVGLDHQPRQCSSWNDFQTILAGIFDKTGIGANFTSSLDESFRKAGLKHVTVEKIQLPAGAKLSNEKEALDSLIPFKITIPRLRQAAQGLSLDLAPSVFEQLEERFEKEMLEEGAVFTSYIVYGQKE